MLLERIYDEDLSQASYVIGCQARGEAIVVDARRDIQTYLDLAAKNGMTIVAVAETHIHADFLSGVRELAELGRSLEEAERSHSDVTETLRRFAEQQRMADAARVRTWAKRAPIHVAFVQALFMLPAAAAILVGPAFVRALKALAALMG